MSEKPVTSYEAAPVSVRPLFPEANPRLYTSEPAGPVELLVMCLARELHDRERPGERWSDLDRTTALGFCRLACESRGIEWGWVADAVTRERLDDQFPKR